MPDHSDLAIQSSFRAEVIHGFEETTKPKICGFRGHVEVDRQSVITNFPVAPRQLAACCA